MATTETTERQAQAKGRGAGNRAPARGPRLTTTVLGALSAFMGAFAFLSFQMGSGNDPALGVAKPVAAAPAPVRRQVIVRKVVITKVRRVRVVVRERVPTPAAKERSIRVSDRVALPAAAAPPKPVSHTAATTHTAPAPKPAPTPKPAPAAAPKPAPAAPAPAPPTTHQS